MEIFFFWSPKWARASSFTRFLDHTQRRATVGRTPLDEWSARRRDLYLTTHNTHNRLASMPPVGFEPTVSASERPQTHALDRAATGTGIQGDMAVTDFDGRKPLIYSEVFTILGMIELAWLSLQHGIEYSTYFLRKCTIGCRDAF